MTQSSQVPHPETTQEHSNPQISGSPEANSLPDSVQKPQPSYVKLAMRNMVRKGGKSLFHFTLTTVGLLALLIGLAYVTR